MTFFGCFFQTKGNAHIALHELDENHSDQGQLENANETEKFQNSIFEKCESVKEFIDEVRIYAPTIITQAIFTRFQADEVLNPVVMMKTSVGQQ
jgi:hypothetical protein